MFFHVELSTMTVLIIAEIVSFGNLVKNEPDNMEDLLVSVRKVSSQGILMNQVALKEEEFK